MAKKAQTISAKIPQTREDAEAEMRQLGRLRIQVSEINNELKRASQILIQKAEDDAEKINAEIKILEEGLSLYAAAHRSELTDGNKSKKGKMLSGYFDWRSLPEKVSLRGVDLVVQRVRDAVLQAHGKAAVEAESGDAEKAREHADTALKLEGFLRVKTEINKEAMLAAPSLAKAIKGVTIKSAGERLEIVVFENELKK
jgi:phage host-nuclease inhibitor protein Gam